MADNQLWLSLYESVYGVPTKCARRASVLAGGWKTLIEAKRKAEAAAEATGWKKPCMPELQAALELLTEGRSPEQGVVLLFLLDGSGSVHDGMWHACGPSIQGTRSACLHASSHADIYEGSPPPMMSC